MILVPVSSNLSSFYPHWIAGRLCENITWVWCTRSHTQDGTSTQISTAESQTHRKEGHVSTTSLTACSLGLLELQIMVSSNQVTLVLGILPYKLTKWQLRLVDSGLCPLYPFLYHPSCHDPSHPSLASWQLRCLQRSPCPSVSR